jgi:glycerol-3-phosphate acyltransferase PlsY
MVSMGSIIAAASIPVAAWLLYRGQENSTLIEPIVLTALGLLAIWRHKSNIGRIIKGKENRIDFRKRK